MILGLVVSFSLQRRQDTNVNNISFNMLRTTLVDIPYYSVNFTFEELTTELTNAIPVKSDNSASLGPKTRGVLMTFERSGTTPIVNNWVTPTNYIDENITSQLRAIFVHRIANKISPLRTLYDQSPHNTGESKFIKTDGSMTGSFTVYQQPIMPNVGNVLSYPGGDIDFGAWECDLFYRGDAVTKVFPSFVNKISDYDGIDNFSPVNWVVPQRIYFPTDNIKEIFGLSLNFGHGSIIRDRNGKFFQWNASGYGATNSKACIFISSTGFLPDDNGSWDDYVISGVGDFPDVETTNDVQSITVTEINPNSPEYGGSGGDGSGGGELNPGGSNILSRFTPRIATGNVGAYKLNIAGVNSFLSELWNTNLVDQIRTSFIGDGSNALLGLKWYYGVGYSVSTASSSPINLGNVRFENVGSFPVVSREFTTFNAGTVTVPSTYNDYRDWTLRTFKAYIPFCGLIDLTADQVVGKQLTLKYNINVTDGSAVVILSNSNDYKDIIFTSSCSWGYDIPIRVEAVPDMTARIFNATGIPSLIKSFGGMGGNENYSSGDLSPNSNVMGDFTPKLIIYTHDDVSGNIGSAIGKPSNTTQNVGSFTGYLKASSVQVPASVQSVPAVHVDTIVEMLKDGVYL